MFHIEIASSASGPWALAQNAYKPTSAYMHAREIWLKDNQNRPWVRVMNDPKKPPLLILRGGTYEYNKDKDEHLRVTQA
jgi:hypothetical protein